jgi:hypothetical protein
MDPSDLENMSPEEIEQLVALGIIPEQMSSMDRQYKQAAALRNTQMPGMEGNGRVMVAASPLAHLSAGVDRYLGNKQMKGIEGKQDQLLKEQAAARNLYLKKYLFPAGPKPGVIKDPLQMGQQTIDPTLKPMGF